MSHQLINLNPDLKLLRDEGYDVEILTNYLMIKQVPYVNTSKEVKFGNLVSELSVAGDQTTAPKDHTVYFAGEHPCDKNGVVMSQIINQSAEKKLDHDLIVHHYFSSKPAGGSYKNHHEKMTTYAAIISSPAHAIDPTVTAKTFPVIETKEDESVFNYIDTASSRAEINVYPES